MPAGTVAGEMEARMRAMARKKKMKGRRADRYVYGAMNEAGVMHGNQVTDKGMEKAHNSMSGMAKSMAHKRRKAY